MTNIHTSDYQRQATFVYSKVFTDRFIGWCFSTKQPVARTFLRKYNDSVSRHEDVTEFIVGKLPVISANEPELLSPETWEDTTALYAGRRARFFTIYKNYCINRWNRYKTINKYETPEVPEMTTNTTATNPNIIRAMIYRQVWNTYTNQLDTTNQIIAMYLLDGSISMSEVEAATGLKKSQIYVRLEKIKAEINKLVEDKKAAPFSICLDDN